MTVKDFSNHLLKIEDKSSRLEMTALLAQLYQDLAADEVVVASYLLQGSLVPAYQSLEFQLSTKMVIKALARVVARQGSAGLERRPQSTATNLFGESDFGDYEKKVTAWYKQLGDIGLVAEKILKEKKEANETNPPFDLLSVHQDLIKIAKEEGAGSQERKISQLVELLIKLDPASGRYIARIIIGRLRLGFSTMTMLDALSWAVTGDKSESSSLELAYQRKADVGELARDYLSKRKSTPASRLELLKKINVEVGIPVMPALCQRLNSAAEIVDKMKQVYAEPKYDGLRVQIHFQSGQPTKVFTRSLDDVSYMFPELNQAESVLEAQSCILDAEAIGFSAQTGELVPFQETITRRRKHGVGEKAKQTPIRFYVFDILSKDGQSLIEEKLQDRKDVLKNTFSDNEVFFHTPYILSTDPKQLRDFHEDQLKVGLEGAVMKQLESRYVSGRKGWNWVKIKEAEGTTGKLADTLDCVVMGYYLGRGKRTQFGLGAILVGVLDAKESIVTIAKIGTGLSEAQLVEVKKECDTLAVKAKPKQFQVHKDLKPDVWVAPEMVVEVAADEVTNSPTHTAKIALRFPRLVQIRRDKSLAQVTTLREAKSLQ